MVALESEVQEYGGWGNISCVQVHGKNADAEIEDVQATGLSMRRLCY